MSINLSMTRRGKLVLVVAPSGSGKDSLIEAACAAVPEITRLITCTTRPMRPSEEMGVDYFFLSNEEFDKNIESGAFLEWAEYGGNRYGTLSASVEEGIAAGKILITDMEVQGARQVRKLLPTEELVIVYIEAGGWETLVGRIRARAPISDEELEKRHARFEDEFSFKQYATYVVQNPDGGFDEAIKQFVNIIKGL